MHSPLPLLTLLALAPFTLTLALPTTTVTTTAATTAKIRGVSSPIYHLYLQPHPNNASLPVLGPEATADEFVISTTILSKGVGGYLTIADTSGVSYKALTFEETGTGKGATGWGLEGDTIITVGGSAWGRR